MSQMRIAGSGLLLFVTALILAMLCFGTLSCSNSEQTWFAEARSPDGKFLVATARTLQPGGWRTGSPPETSVDLNWTTGSQKPEQIFQFVGDVDQPDDMKVGMVWLSPTHLEITYRPKRIIEFQAVKCFDVNISVQEAGGAPAR